MRYIVNLFDIVSVFSFLLLLGSQFACAREKKTGWNSEVASFESNACRQRRMKSTIYAHMHPHASYKTMISHAVFACLLHCKAQCSGVVAHCPLPAFRLAA